MSAAMTQCHHRCQLLRDGRKLLRASRTSGISPTVSVLRMANTSRFRHHRILVAYTTTIRRCAENAFGVLASRFRIFRRTINLLPEHADYVVMATCALHNYLRDDSVYIPPSYVDKEDAYGNITNGNWRSTFKDDETVMTDLEPPVGHNYSGSAREARDLFCSYFMSRQGAVPWQRTSAGLRP
ncbi:uncharacterized protein LOC120842886 isoform X2 [Ixodes scapularis]|uniref:uncharacterized protein LOC120842886 isoform X2 n=1 Tax=Ixodes scapularis TaxID=6945 RepID=UPI001A9F6426|nr:uncharacterized protein LOC120842886 isoform X2 [Ixodes scapularis]